MSQATPSPSFASATTPATQLEAIARLLRDQCTAVLQVQQEALILRALCNALVDTHPDPSALRQAFAEEVARLDQDLTACNAPGDALVSSVAVLDRITRRC